MVSRHQDTQHLRNTAHPPLLEFVAAFIIPLIIPFIIMKIVIIKDPKAIVPKWNTTVVRKLFNIGDPKLFLLLK